MGLPRSPAPATGRSGPTEASSEGAASPVIQPEVTAPPDPGTSSRNTDVSTSPEPAILKAFRLQTDKLNASTIATGVSEKGLREGLRKLMTSKNSIDAENIAGSISKTAYLAAEKRFTQTRAAVLHKVKTLNPHIKTLTDLIRVDIPPREGAIDSETEGTIKTRSKKGRPRKRSVSRTPLQSPNSLQSPREVGFRPIRREERRIGSAPSNLLQSQALASPAPWNGYVPAHGAHGNPLQNLPDASALSGPYGPLILQGLLYRQQQSQWSPLPDPNHAGQPHAGANLGMDSVLSVIQRQQAAGPRSHGRDGMATRAPGNGGHQDRGNDDDDVYFAREFGGELSDLRRISFPEGWRYPDDRNFDKYFEKTDFMKAKKAGTLRTFDGTIASYPDFRAAFYRHVHVQRGPVLDKITTLDSLVPSKFFNEHFRGLDLTVYDYKIRIERLERQFGGDKRQLEHLLAKVGEFLRNPSGHSARDLQGFVYAMESHFSKPNTHAAQKEVLATFLQVALPDVVRLEYHTFLNKDQKDDTPESFMGFLQNKIDAELRSAQQKRVFHGSERVLKKGKVLTSMQHDTPEEEEPGQSDTGAGGACQIANSNNPTICAYCKVKSHPLFRCFKFASATHEQKIKFVKDENRCRKCLRTGHLAKECTQVISCDFCENPFGTDHNRLLHRDPDAHVTVAEGRTPAFAYRAERQLVGTRPVAAASMVLHLRCPKTGKEVAINALPDTGATDFILDTSVADRLNIKGDSCQYTVLGHAGHETVHECITGEIVAINPLDKREYNLKYFAYEGPCEGMFPENWGRLKNNWDHLKVLDLPCSVDGKPFEAIIGCRYLSLLEPRQSGDIHIGKLSDDPVAKLTPLGWIMAGKTSKKAWGNAAATQGIVSGMAMPAKGLLGDGLEPDYKGLYFKLKEDLEKVWNLETEDEMRRLANCFSPSVKTVAEARAETQLKEGLEFIKEEGRYQTSLLWRADQRPDNNYGAAKRMYLQLEGSLESDPEKKEAFHKAHEQWIEAGYLERAKVDLDQEEQFFLPGFIVTRETTHGKTYRYVMNGAKEFKGKSLNDHLLPGPNLMNNLAEVLVRFRRNNFVLTCDIQHMFLGILVAPRDRKFLRIIYRKTPREELEIYQCTRHVFGLCCSPYVAMGVVLHHAQRNAYRWPLAYDLVKNHIIVDDILASFSHMKELLEAKEELRQLFGSMGLRPHKWASNCEQALDDIPEDEKAKAVVLGLSEDLRDSPCIRTLGILWHSDVDAFQFSFKPQEPPRWTMRTLSSVLGRLYDPSCLLSPITVQGKELLQAAWQHQKHWDQPLPDEIIKKMRTYLKNHHHTEHILISRQAIGVDPELMIFTDASTQALAAAAYVVSVINGKRIGRLLWAKHKLASVKGNETVPRLELAAALMGTQLAFFVCKAFGWDLMTVTYFTDSLTVLWWLQSTQALAPYVANRLKQILERSSYNQWLHVRTELNPADLPTRGTRPEALANHPLWWEGPGFLQQDPASWEAQPDLYETEDAAAEKRTLATLCKNIVMAARASVSGQLPTERWIKAFLLQSNSFNKGCRVLDLVFRALTRMTPSRQDYPEAKVIAWKCAQKEAFPTLRWQLEKGETFEKQYWELQPYLDENMLIRINSRLTPRLETSRDAARPILLHHRMDLAQLLAWELHAVMLKHCGGHGALLTRLRAEYWIVGGPGLAKRTLSNCHYCARLHAKPHRLPLPPLHPSRSGLFQEGGLRAFAEIGLDFCGPFFVSVGRSQVKRHVLVIVCCTTRAVNIEVCHKLDGKSCLAGLERHMARYGRPDYINSDNGTNFIASARHLEERLKVLRLPEIPEAVRWTANIEWYFNPPASPTWTGHVECFVKMVKKSLKLLRPRIKTSLSDEELLTLIAQAQGFINMRPLVKVSPDKPPLTPADFLLTGSGRLSFIPVVAPEKLTLATRKELIDANLNEVWDQFSRDYVLSLRKNLRLLPSKKRIQTKDAVVFLDDDNSKMPGKWRQGVVIGTHPGKDNEDRSFDILVEGDRMFKRNYRNLGLLPRPTLIPDGYLLNEDPRSEE